MIPTPFRFERDTVEGRETQARRDLGPDEFKRRWDSDFQFREWIRCGPPVTGTWEEMVDPTSPWFDQNAHDVEFKALERVVEGIQADRMQEAFAVQRQVMPQASRPGEGVPLLLRKFPADWSADELAAELARYEMSKTRAIQIFLMQDRFTTAEIITALATSSPLVSAARRYLLKKAESDPALAKVLPTSIENARAVAQRRRFELERGDA